MTETTQVAKKETKQSKKNWQIGVVSEFWLSILNLTLVYMHTDKPITVWLMQ